jgi:hypothetical protein
VPEQLPSLKSDSRLVRGRSQNVSPESLHHITTTADDNKQKTLQLYFKKGRTNRVAKAVQSALV